MNENQRDYELQAIKLIENLDSLKNANNRVMKLGQLWKGYSGGCRCPIGEYKDPFDRIQPTREAIHKLHKLYANSTEETKIIIMGALSSPEPYIKEAMEILLEGMESPSVKVRINAARSIRAIGQSAQPFLDKIIMYKCDPITAVRFEIEQAINTLIA